MKTISSILFLITFLSGCGSNSSSQKASPPTGKPIQLTLNLKPGDQKKLTVELNSDSKIQANGEVVKMSMNVVSTMGLEVLEINEEGEYLIKSIYDKISMKMDGPIKMNFDSSNLQDSKSPIGNVLSSTIGQSYTIRMSKTGRTLGFEVAKDMNPLVKQQIEQTMQNFTLGTTFPKKKVDNGDSWKSSITQDVNGIKITNDSNNTLLDQTDGITTIGISGNMTGSMTGESQGLIKIDSASGWLESGEISMKCDMRKDNQEVETKIKIMLSGS